jgi:hypothetical protein
MKSSSLALVSVLALVHSLACGSGDEDPGAAAGTAGADASGGNDGNPSGSGGSGAAPGGGSGGETGGGSAGTAAGAAGGGTGTDCSASLPPAADGVYAADHPDLVYSGRIDFAVPAAPVLYYPASTVRARFEGTSLKLRLSNDQAGKSNWVSVFIDDAEPWVSAIEGNQAAEIEIATNLAAGVHEVVIAKRSDTNSGALRVHGLELDPGSNLLPPCKELSRRIECYGDSVTAGSVTDAADYVNKSDPPQDTWPQYNNGYMSFCAIAGRALDAETHVNAIGGLGLVTGYQPNTLQDTWDELQPYSWGYKPWDFARYAPHVVVSAIGQNDFYTSDLTKAAAQTSFKSAYKTLVTNLRGKHPEAAIVLMTTVMAHGAILDTLVESVVTEYKAEHAGEKNLFFFKPSKAGTVQGHPRVVHQQEMADELVAFIGTLALAW